MTIKITITIVTICMTLGAVLFFIWAVKSGQFSDIEEIKYSVFEKEKSDEE